MERIPLLDLFSGVGAYSLGLERSGLFRTVAFCEIEEYPRKILRRHWPDVPIYEDVTTLTAARLAADGIVPRWAVAGWPCQDVSVVGTGTGLDGERSGLWCEIERLARELGLDGLVLENSSNLLAINGGRDFGRVLGDLAALGFDAEWHCLPAAGFDAPHIRDRLWIVAHRKGSVAFAADPRLEGHAGDGAGSGERRRVAPEQGGHASPRGLCANDADAHGLAPIGSAIARAERHTWEPEPDVGRVVAGCPNRVDRIEALGNLNPPIIPETIGRALMEVLAP